MPLPPRYATERRHTAVDKLIDLSSVFIDPELLPRERLAACFRAVARRPKLQVAYHAQGFLPLRQIIAERLRPRGIAASAEDIVTTAGSQQALDIVCRALVCKRIATENPTYELGKLLFGMNHVETIGLPLDPFTGINVDVWQGLLATFRPALVYLTTNFHNPTGYSYATSELQHILHWSQQYGFGILEDDWGSDMLSFPSFVRRCVPEAVMVCYTLMRLPKSSCQRSGWDTSWAIPILCQPSWPPKRPRVWGCPRLWKPCCLNFLIVGTMMCI